MRIYTAKKNRFLGTFRGFVTRIDDPDGQFRIKATVPMVTKDQETNWALPCCPGGPRDVRLPAIDDMVWISFEDGDPNFPMWAGGFPSTNQGKKAVVPEALGKDGNTVLPPRGTGGVTLADGKIMLEPAVAFCGEYGCESRKTSGGHRLEVDPTPDNTRLAVIHKSQNYSKECDDQGCCRTRMARNDSTCSGSNNCTNRGPCRTCNCAPCYTENRKDCNTVNKGKCGYTYAGNVQVVLNGGENELQCNGVLEITGAGQLKLSIGSALGQNVVGNLQEGIMGAQENVSLENKQEIVGNASARAVGKSVEVIVGKYTMLATTGIINADGALGVKLGNEVLAIEPLLKGTSVITLLNQFITWAMTHTHPSDGAPATPPWTGGLLIPGVHSSLKVTTE